MPTTATSTSRDPQFIAHALARAGYGAKPGEIDDLARRGFAQWVDEQLAPDDAADTACQQRLDAATLAIKYPAGPNTPDAGGVPQTWPVMDEQRPLSLLSQPIDRHWALLDRATAMDYTERRRPRDEVIAATILRAVHSRWQLREQMVDFWHKHFSINAYAGDQIMVALPSYDRDVIRAHCLGNFRTFLEAVATSAAMQFYLSNRSSRAGAANENYARELFELHTLGRDAYLNDHYNRWRDVPGALKGAPAGYIDQDVYEAARAFTGWTIADGSRVDGSTVLPKTGQFAYVDAWHDGYQKRVLGNEFDPFRKAQADGRDVLDLVAAHPATARFLCTKLVTRLVSEDPPPALVTKAMAAWRAHIKAPDQIARVVRVILLSPEFAAARGACIRRPLAIVASFARATDLDLAPTEALANEIGNAGERLFGWPSPDGLPETARYFITTDSLRHRWNLVIGLADNAWKNGTLPHQSDGSTPRALTRRWISAFAGAPDAKAEAAILTAFGASADQPLGDTPDAMHRAARIAAYAALIPSFQTA
jgi:uncharacterized protein (DUF1800 family)